VEITHFGVHDRKSLGVDYTNKRKPRFGRDEIRHNYSVEILYRHIFALGKMPSEGWMQEAHRAHLEKAVLQANL
jgi:hypothetical protein